MPPNSTAMLSIPHLKLEGGGGGTYFRDIIVNIMPNINDNPMLAIMGKPIRLFILKTDRIICTTGAIAHINKMDISI
ncbi:MAG: hypothetical protein JWQ57_2523 [Mucilaginibacter sp.]|nr:hypothetical protein [Mucilaginibacter sp.]